MVGGSPPAIPTKSDFLSYQKPRDREKYYEISGRIYSGR